MANRRSSNDEVIESSGNVFEDLRLPDAAERQTKVRLALAINRVLDVLALTQVDTAKRLGISQPKVSAVKNYRLEGFSAEKLMQLLTALDQDVEIVIRDKPRSSRRSARIVVRAA